ncbi:MAG: LPS export ABC transporter periplasmic protein LptC [Endomicrobium sp.]|nr:LPS export ABC transporter periplasmic protein LptC [Endomicrobium sp.]
MKLCIKSRCSILLCLITIVFFLFILGCTTNNIIEMSVIKTENFIEEFIATEMYNGKSKMIMKAKSAITDYKNRLVYIKLPEIKFYDINGEYILTFTAEDVYVYMDTHNIKAVGKCIIDTKRNEHLYTSDLMYNAEKKLIYSDNNVKITRCGETVYGTSFKTDQEFDRIIVKNYKVVI